MHRRAITFAGAALWVLAAGLAPSLDAQEEGDPWTGEGELGASVFFGNTEQTVVTTRAALSHQGTVWELSTDGSFAYGEVREESGRDLVNKRSWAVTGQADREVDQSPWSTFVEGKAESSLEKRIDLRYDLGAGTKHTFVENDRSHLDLSLALLGERTIPREEPEDPQESTLLARWSGRLRARRTLSDGRLTFQSETFYRPEFDDPENFTLESRNSLSYALTEVVSLKLTFVDEYDSEAVERGAGTNNDGQLLFSVLSSFE